MAIEIGQMFSQVGSNPQALSAMAAGAIAEPTPIGEAVLLGALGIFAGKAVWNAVKDGQIDFGLDELKQLSGIMKMTTPGGQMDIASKFIANKVRQKIVQGSGGTVISETPEQVEGSPEDAVQRGELPQTAPMQETLSRDVVDPRSAIIDNTPSVETRTEKTPLSGGDFDRPVQTSLEDEAKKYKSAEEFVGSKDIVYHGTPKKFESFSNESIGSLTDEGDVGAGIYFAKDKGEATAYAKGKDGNVIEATLDIKKPFVIGNDYVAEQKRIRQEQKDSGSAVIKSSNKFVDNLIKMIQKHDQSFNIEPSSKFQALSVFDVVRKFGSKKFTEVLKKEGYDGVDYLGEMVVFDKSQIKTKQQLTDIWNKAHGGGVEKDRAVKLFGESDFKGAMFMDTEGRLIKSNGMPHKSNAADITGKNDENAALDDVLNSGLIRIIPGTGAITIDIRKRPSKAQMDMIETEFEARNEKFRTSVTYDLPNRISGAAYDFREFKKDVNRAFSK